ARQRAPQRRAAVDLRGARRQRAPRSGGAGTRARWARRPHGAQAQRALRRPAPARGDRPRARERTLHPSGRRADRQLGLGDRRGDHAAVRGVARHGTDHRAGHARSRHRGARLPSDPLARRARRARREHPAPDPAMTDRRSAAPAAAVLLLAAACQKAQTAPLYEAVPVEHRDIVVTASASGVMQPILTFSVKSKAWGEIIEMRVQTGDEVKKGQLLARIDPRIPQQNLAEAQAAVDKARAQLQTATAQFKRSEDLFKSQSIAETEYEASKLAQATAAATVVTAEAMLQTAKDAMEDTQVRAPITGSILELDAVLGTVISIPTLGGGTVILKMASLDTVQDSAMVAETDIGRVQPGLPVTITVDAFPNRSFDGIVLKIGPQAQVVQNLTTFPVFVNIPNPGHLLKPAMNTEERRRALGRRACPPCPGRRPVAAVGRWWQCGPGLAGRSGEQLHRVRAPRREGHVCADQDGSVGSGLHRSHGRPD